jgi:hypothetical protein
MGATNDFRDELWDGAPEEENVLEEKEYEKKVKDHEPIYET